MFLVRRDPVGRLQDGLQARVGVLDALGVVLATLEVRDVVHRARAVQGVEGHEVVEAVGPDLLEHPLHPAGLELEHPERVAPREELQRLLIVEGDVPYVHLFTGCFADGLQSLLDDVEVTQAQEVDLEEPQRLDVAHRVLDHDGVLVPRDALERHDIGEGSSEITTPAAWVPA